MGMRRPGLGLGFELGVSFNSETGKDSGGGSASVGLSGSFTDLTASLFGTDTSQTTDSAQTTTGKQTEFINIDKEGVLKMVEDALKGVGGLAEIFGLEKGAGLSSSSAAKSGTEDLLAKIAGELAKATASKTTLQGGSKESTATQSSSSKGLFDRIGV